MGVFDRVVGVLESTAAVLILLLSILGPLSIILLAVIAIRTPKEVHLSWPIIALFLLAVSIPYLPFVREIKSDWLSVRFGSQKWASEEAKEEQKEIARTERGEISPEGKPPERGEFPESAPRRDDLPDDRSDLEEGDSE